MLHQGGSCGFHLVATPCADIGIGIQIFNGFYQIASMQIAGSFACYEVIFHTDAMYDANEKWRSIVFVEEDSKIKISPFYSFTTIHSKIVNEYNPLLKGDLMFLQ